MKKILTITFLLCAISAHTAFANQQPEAITPLLSPSLSDIKPLIDASAAAPAMREIAKPKTVRPALAKPEANKEKHMSPMQAQLLLSVFEPTP